MKFINYLWRLLHRHSIVILPSNQKKYMVKAPLVLTRNQNVYNIPPTKTKKSFEITCINFYRLAIIVKN